jgi:hypothetical protein
LAVSEVSDEPTFLLATLPPTSGQRRLALAVVAVLLAAFGIAAPFAAIPLPRIDAFIPSLEAIFFLSDFITAALLFFLDYSFTRTFSPRECGAIPTKAFDADDCRFGRAIP